ncbi:uncharacterized protein [Montipora capricornis]|uniref:uncharacterized protein n=1 Tax=Montipora capricornis TaxID=246305 RepID=UPI0035F16125
MEHQMPCSSSAADNSSVHLIEIVDDFPVLPVPPEQENLEEPLVDCYTSKEQEATNVSLTRSEDEHDVSEGEIHAESTPNSAPGGNKRKTPYSVKFDELPETVRKFLASVKKFFTQTVNFEREKAPVALSTYDKAQERMLCFLGYVKNTLGRDAEILPECFLRTPLIEGYVEFLKEERNCSSATVSNHLSSLLYPIKFVNKEDAPDFKGVPIIRQLRTQARILQKAGDLERPTTMEDLSAQNRWIPWEEVVSAVSKQREKFELTGPMKFKAKEFCDLIMLSLYVFIPPARGLEIRTLEVLSGEQASNFDPKSSTGKNYLIVKDSGDIVLHFNNYKTRKFSGRDELALQPQDELCRLLLSYIKDYRPHMVTDSSGRYLLLIFPEKPRLPKAVP